MHSTNRARGRTRPQTATGQSGDERASGHNHSNRVRSQHTYNTVQSTKGVNRIRTLFVRRNSYTNVRVIWSKVTYVQVTHFAQSSRRHYSWASLSPGSAASAILPTTRHALDSSVSLNLLSWLYHTYRTRSHIPCLVPSFMLTAHAHAQHGSGTWKDSSPDCTQSVWGRARQRTRATQTEFVPSIHRVQRSTISTLMWDSPQYLGLETASIEAGPSWDIPGSLQTSQDKESRAQYCME